MTVNEFKSLITKNQNREHINMIYELFNEYLVHCSVCGATEIKIDDYALCGRKKCRDTYNAPIPDESQKNKVDVNNEENYFQKMSKQITEEIDDEIFNELIQLPKSRARWSLNKE